MKKHIQQRHNYIRTRVGLHILEHHLRTAKEGRGLCKYLYYRLWIAKT